MGPRRRVYGLSPAGVRKILIGNNVARRRKKKLGVKMTEHDEQVTHPQHTLSRGMLRPKKTAPRRAVGRRDPCLG